MRKFKYVLVVVVVLFSINTQAQSETKIDDEKIEDFTKKMCSAPLGFRIASAKKSR